MAEVITFLDYRPPARFDGRPWTQARIQEASVVDGSYVLVDTVTLTPVDTDPAQPAARSFTTEKATAVGYWYVVVFVDATGDTSQPTTPVQNVAGSTGPPVVAYATVAELARILQLVNPSSAQTVALQRVLDAAALEIDKYLALTVPLTVPYPALVVSVNLDRAADIWKSEQSPYGIVNLGGETAPAYPSRSSWRRHASRLLPIKERFGLA